MIPSPYDQYMTGGPLPWADRREEQPGWLSRIGKPLLNIASLIPGPQQPFVAGANIAASAASKGTGALIDPAIWAAVLPHIGKLADLFKEAGPGFTSQTWNAAGGISPPSRSPLVSPGSWRP
jgi:hypothetical protein